MRVIAGSAKGVRLGPVPRGVRPVSDMAREGLFSSLAAGVHGASVLDLYAGTGALAIEALSRGAERAVLVDRSRPAVAAIRDNLARSRLAEAAEVRLAEVGAFVMGDDKSGPFDLVVADPPYDTPVEQVERVLARLGAGWLPEAGWAVVLTRPTRNPTLVVPVHWLPARRLVYGDTLVWVFREA